MGRALRWEKALAKGTLLRDGLPEFSGQTPTGHRTVVVRGNLDGFFRQRGEKRKVAARFLPPELWERFLKTWSCEEIPAVRDTVFPVCGLLKEVFRLGASHFALVFPEKDSRRSF